MASNTGQIVIIGAIGLAAVYMLTKSKPTPQTPITPSPSTIQQQQQQLLQWAQTQNAASTITSIIKNLDWNGIVDMFGKIFGSSSGSDYSGGGTDNPVNPYPQYDPYYTGGEIWV